jgi:hypothetical protein
MNSHPCDITGNNTTPPFVMVECVVKLAAACAYDLPWAIYNYIVGRVGAQHAAPRREAGQRRFITLGLGPRPCWTLHAGTVAVARTSPNQRGAQRAPRRPTPHGHARHGALGPTPARVFHTICARSREGGASPGPTLPPLKGGGASIVPRDIVFTPLTDDRPSTELRGTRPTNVGPACKNIR